VFSIRDFYIDRIMFGLNANARSAYFDTSPTESTTPDDAAKQATERMQDIQRLQDDKWCIEYLKTYYVAAISEGMYCI